MANQTDTQKIITRNADIKREIAAILKAELLTHVRMVASYTVSDTHRIMASGSIATVRQLIQTLGIEE